MRNKLARGMKITTGDFVKAAIVVAVFVCLLVGSFIEIMRVHVYGQYVFNKNYTAHLKRAADANSIELAHKELNLALGYLSSKGITSTTAKNLGFIHDNTGLILEMTENQVSFHLQNVESCRDEAAIRMQDESSVAKTNFLIKLRETLIDTSHNGSTEVTVPTGFYLYPNNTLYGTLVLVVPIVLMIIGFFMPFLAASIMVLRATRGLCS